MREIKFRAWWKGQMFYEPDCETEKLNDVFREVGGRELMQFTGVLDKNKKEIYDGDTIKDERGVLLEVSWGETEWLAGKLALNANNFFEGECKYLEIIGNIYENEKCPECGRIGGHSNSCVTVE